MDAMIKLLFILLCLLLSHCYPAYCSTANTTKAHDAAKCQYVLSYNYGTEHCTYRGNYLPKQKHKTMCKNTSYCPWDLNITLIDYWPFSYLFYDQINDMLGKCCGECQLHTVLKNVKKVMITNSSALTTSDMVYPVFGQKRFTRLHGHWFIPFMDIPPGLYVGK